MKKKLTTRKLRKQGIEMIQKCIDLLFNGSYERYKVYFNQDNNKFYCGYESILNLFKNEKVPN